MGVKIYTVARLAVRPISSKSLYKCTDLPSDIQLVVTDKVRMITLESIENQTLIRFRDLRIRKPPLVGQVHLSWDRTGVQSRCLRVQLEVNGFRRLNTHNEFISGNILEDTLGDILELNTDLDLGLIDS